MTVVLLYGVLVFVYQMSSRREANQKMTRPAFMESMKRLFPELETIPHHDTLNRLLCEIEVTEIEQTHLEVLRQLIRNKKFHNYLLDNTYPIAIDGTQKVARYQCFDERWLERNVGKDEDQKKQHYVYVLEANMVFHNGMVLPLMSEFLDYNKGDTSNDKQDCETRAFIRLAARLKKAFPRLKMTLLLDGLYPNGPVMSTCHKNNWQYMIVLQDKSLSSVWKEFNSLKDIEKNNTFKMTWGTRYQRFTWVNQIQYDYGQNQKKHLKVHVVVCEECWEVIDPNTCEPTMKTSRHVWISSQPLHQKNVHERCNLGARHRWGIESGILIEKHYGYSYEHLFSQNWNAMTGFHYLMRMGHLLNVLTQYSTAIRRTVQKLGVKGFIDLVTSTLMGCWLNAKEVCQHMKKPFRLRFE